MRDERFELNIMIGAQGADKLTEHLVRVGATAGDARFRSARQAASRLRGTNDASSRKDNALLATAGVLSESVPNAARHETSHGNHEIPRGPFKWTSGTNLRNGNKTRQFTCLFLNVRNLFD